MNKNDFNRFIGAGLVPGGADLEGARELTGLFPWFHSAHLVLLRGLRESSDIKFESQLKGSALYVADRSKLYHYLFLNVPESSEAAPVGVSESVPVAVSESVPVGVSESVPVAAPEPEIESQEPQPEPVVDVPEPVVDLLEPVVELPEPQPEAVNDPPEPVVEIEESPSAIEIHGTDQEVETPEAGIESQTPVVDLLEPVVELPEPEIEPSELQPMPDIETQELVAETEVPEIIAGAPDEITDVPVPEPEAVVPFETQQEEPHTAEQFTENTSLKTRDELIAEIEARLVELEKGDLLELAEGDEVTVDPASDEAHQELVPAEEVTVDPISDEAPHELVPAEEVTADPIPDEALPEITEPEEIVIDTLADESPEASIAETDELPGPEAATGEMKVPEPVKQLSPNDLIDRFIQTSPRIERMVPGEVPLLMDLSEHRTEEHTPFITETLARIYVNQGYYTRAINIYEKLTLQFPEKCAYFASRIEKIKELIK